MRVHVYDNTILDDEYSYWISTPFADGSECYSYFDFQETKRFTLHKRYRGKENGVHKYWTINDAINAADERYYTGTNNRNVYSAFF
jgi:hypothetical protein